MKPSVKAVFASACLMLLMAVAVPSSFADGLCKSQSLPASENDFMHTPSAFVEDDKSKLIRFSLAVSSNDLDSVKTFLQQGLSPDADTDGAGLTPLMLAESGEMVKLLLEAGANVKKTDNRGWNCLHHAATRNGTVIAARMLIRAGAEHSKRNDDGDTPALLTRLLFIEKIAPEWGKNYLTLLVNSGANIDATDTQGMTLLHYAATSDCLELAEVCLMLGADPDLMTSYGKAPRQLARELKAQKVYKFFPEEEAED